MTNNRFPLRGPSGDVGLEGEGRPGWDRRRTETQ